MLGFDRRGFGKSEGEPKGDIGYEILEECIAFVETAIKHYGIEKEKKFYYGVSMGSLLIGRLASERPDLVDGVIMTVPWLQNNKRIFVNKKMRFLLKIVSCLCRNKRPPPSTRD